MIERDKKIIDLYLNHPEVSNKDIAQQFNVSISTISRIARINNLPRRTGQSGTRLTQQQIKEIKKKYEQCCPLIQLQKYLYQNHNNHYLKKKHNLIQANTEVTN